MVVVDTNFLVRLITREPAVQLAEALQIYEKSKPKSLLVDRVIITECMYVLQSNYKFTRTEILELVGDLLKGKVFDYIDGDICGSMFKIMHNSNLSPQDACLVALVQQKRARSVATFDAGIQKFLAR